MPLSRWFCAVLLLFSSSLIPSSPHRTVASPDVQRDPQGLEILVQTLNAAGGLATLAAIQDETGVGAITYYSSDDPVQGNVTVKGRGLTQFRLDATLPDGTRSVISNNGSGSITQPDGSITAIPYYLAINMGTGVHFPLLQLISAVQDSTVSVSYLGLTSHDGVSVHDIRIHGLQTSAPISGAASARLPARDVLVDPISFQVVAMLVSSYTEDGSVSDQSTELQFSNFKNVDGVITPQTITNVVAGQNTFVIQLTQISFNTGLSDADFQQ